MVWTGGEMIVWGGGGSASTLRDVGAAYDVVAGTWRPIAPAPPGLARRMWHTATWTGTSMLVWGGYVEDAATAAPGAEYVPGEDRWSLLGRAGAETIELSTAGDWLAAIVQHVHRRRVQAVRGGAMPR